MIHLGDITQIHGYDIPPVDVITGGSPCQDLSVAGKRAGLEGERSGLFMEQIRIIKEMRDATANDDIRMVKPRWAIWENVPGALSSGTPKGADFQAVLTEFVRIAEPNAPDVPLPAKWGGAGVLMGRSWSIAYKIHDAQFWGVPQRRRRIAVVADFAGHAAPWVLFGSEFRGETEDGEPDKTERHPGISDEREVQPQSPRLSGDTQQSEEAWEGTAGDPEAGTGESDDGIIYV